MANKTVSLVRLCKTPDGWRRYPVVFGGNGRIKPGWAKVGDKEHHFPNGKYQLREYEGSKIKYKTADGSASDALVALRKREYELSGKAEAEAAGLKVLEPETRQAHHRVNQVCGGYPSQGLGVCCWRLPILRGGLYRGHRAEVC